MQEDDAVDHVLRQWAGERPDLATVAMGLLGRVHRLSERARAVTGPTFASHGLTSPDFDVLATLRRAGEPYRLTPGALSDTLLLTSAGMTGRLDRLETRGLVQRGASMDDRRTRLVTLTESGLAVVERCLADLVQTQEELVSVLSADEQVELAALLRRWLRHTESLLASGPVGPRGTGDRPLTP